MCLARKAGFAIDPFNVGDSLGEAKSHFLRSHINAQDDTILHVPEQFSPQQTMDFIWVVHNEACLCVKCMSILFVRKFFSTFRNEEKRMYMIKILPPKR